MNILIIEDELIASKQLVDFIHKYDSNFKILNTLRSVKDAIIWFEENELPDLIFSDIELLDGNVFALFDKVKINAPIIFTTAYDQFLLKAFKENSIAYILKPFDYEKVNEGFDKYFALKNSFSTKKESLDSLLIEQFKLAIQPNSKTYKSRFTVKMKNGIHILPVEDIIYFKLDEGLVLAYDKQNQKFPLNGTLNEIMEMISPTLFFRISRSEIVHIDFIEKIENYFNDRLSIKMKVSQNNLLVSANRVPEFRKWLEI
jgi:two-component system, LytTR family, response regulator LytT